MLSRIGTAVVGIPVSLIIIYQGNWIFLSLLSILAIMGLKELTNIYKALEIPVFMSVAVPSTVLMIVAFYYMEWWSVLLILTLSIIAVSVLLLLYYPAKSILYFGGTISAIIYIVWIFGFPAILRNMDSGFALLLYLLLVIWGTDTGAYFTGFAIGKSPLAPKLSPKKTVEGSIGGILTAAIIGAVFSAILEISLTMSISLAVLTSVFAQIGDLFESMIKRKAEVKDSGEILPGHGGILDRFDSFFLSAAIFYLVAVYFLNTGI